MLPLHHRASAPFCPALGRLIRPRCIDWLLSLVETVRFELTKAGTCTIAAVAVFRSWPSYPVKRHPHVPGGLCCAGFRRRAYKVLFAKRVSSPELFLRQQAFEVETDTNAITA